MTDGESQGWKDGWGREGSEGGEGREGIKGWNGRENYLSSICGSKHLTTIRESQILKA